MKAAQKTLSLCESFFSKSIGHTPLNLRIINFVGDKWNGGGGRIEPRSSSPPGSRLSASIASTLRPSVTNRLKKIIRRGTRS